MPFHTFADEVGSIKRQYLDDNFAWLGYGTGAPVLFSGFLPAGYVTDGSIDYTTQFQAFINAISSNVIGGAAQGIMPWGKYTIALAKINFPDRYCRLMGAGMFQTVLNCGTLASSFLAATAIQYFSPHFSDFAIVGTGGASQHAIDFSGMAGVSNCEVFDFVFERMYIWTGGASFNGSGATQTTPIFSGKFDQVIVNSYHEHGFKLQCGPAVSFRAAYASQIPAGKAGYRIAGAALLLACNGVDAGDYWGIFGQHPGAGDGFQNDFPGVGVDYPSIRLKGCNVEAYAVTGLLAHEAYLDFDIDGGSIVAPSAGYSSDITVAQGSLANYNPVRLNLARVFTGGAPSNAHLYAPVAQPVFEDLSGAFIHAGITNYYVTAYAGTVPLQTQSAANDVYQDSAALFNAISPQRITFGINHYLQGTSTPVGAAQALNVTGFIRWLVTPAAAASITTAPFTGTPGSGQDYQRNGDLIIEAGNANLTINHSAAGADTFHMAAGANLNLFSGQVCRFFRSVTSSQWIQA